MADLPQGVSKKMGENLEGLQEPQLGLRRLNSQLEAFIEASRNRAVLTACNKYFRATGNDPRPQGPGLHYRAVLPACQPA